MGLFENPTIQNIPFHIKSCATFSAIFFASDPLHTFTFVAEVAGIFPAAKIGGLVATPGNGKRGNYCMPCTTYVAGVSIPTSRKIQKLTFSCIKYRSYHQ